LSKKSKSHLEEWVEQAFTYTNDKPLPDLVQMEEPAPPKTQSSISRSSMRGVHALQELMETERDFVKDLRILVKV
jgi:hypothetical protein